MTYVVFKTLITAIVVVAVSEIGQRSSLLGGVLASLPLVSFLAMIWLYLDTRDVGQVSQLATSILWMILPSLSLFILLPLLLERGIDFWVSLTMSTATMVGLYVAMLRVLARFGAEL